MTNVKKQKVIALIISIVIVLGLGTVCVTQCAFFNETKVVKASPVDTSILKPLADYPNYDLDELKARIEEIGTKEGVQDFSGNNNQDGSAQYDFCMGERREVSVYLWINKGAAGAEASPSFEDRPPMLSQVKPKVITLSKDVQIASTPVYKYRDNEAPWSYEPSYNLDTAVRLGNMIANINETSDDPNTIGTDTNKALAQIVSVLLPDAKTTPK